MKIKKGTIDLGPQIPVAIQWGKLYPSYQFVQLDNFPGWRVSKSFIAFLNTRWKPSYWDIANGHGVCGGRCVSLEAAYDLAQEMEKLPINWNVEKGGREPRPEVTQYTDPIVERFKEQGLIANGN